MALEEQPTGTAPQRQRSEWREKVDEGARDLWRFSGPGAMISTALLNTGSIEADVESGSKARFQVRLAVVAGPGERGDRRGAAAPVRAPRLRVRREPGRPLHHLLLPRAAHLQVDPHGGHHPELRHAERHRHHRGAAHPLAGRHPLLRRHPALARRHRGAPAARQVRPRQARDPLRTLHRGHCRHLRLRVLQRAAGPGRGAAGHRDAVVQRVLQEHLRAGRVRDRLQPHPAQPVPALGTGQGQGGAVQPQGQGRGERAARQPGPVRRDAARRAHVLRLQRVRHGRHRRHGVRPDQRAAERGVHRERKSLRRCLPERHRGGGGRPLQRRGLPGLPLRHGGARALGAGRAGLLAGRLLARHPGRPHRHAGPAACRVAALAARRRRAPPGRDAAPLRRPLHRHPHLRGRQRRAEPGAEPAPARRRAAHHRAHRQQGHHGRARQQLGLHRLFPAAHRGRGVNQRVHGRQPVVGAPAQLVGLRGGRGAAGPRLRGAHRLPPPGHGLVDGGLQAAIHMQPRPAVPEPALLDVTRPTEARCALRSPMDDVTEATEGDTLCG